MPIIDVVKYESNEDELMFKYPTEDIKLGSQLIVDVSQTAFFVKGGKIFDQFNSGTYTLTTENIPILNKIINLPFGSQSPFQAEVWFVNLTSKLDLKWGTINPINLEDPKYGVIVPIRAFGQFGIRIQNPKLFFESLVGNTKTFSSEKVNEYFKGKILSSLTTIISNKLTKDQISVLEINSLLDELSSLSQTKLNQSFLEFGIELINFYFISINFPENDQSILKLKESKDLAAKLKILGRDLYQMDRSFDVLDKAAGNDSGLSGTLAGAGIGLGLGSVIGQNMGNLNSSFNVSQTSPNISGPSNPNSYFFIINDKQIGPIQIDKISELVSNGSITINSFAWKPGMTDWERIMNIPDLLNTHFNFPPIPPKS